MKSLIRHLFDRDIPLGARGERFAARWLKRRGYRIIERNLHLARDEADIVAVDPDGSTIVIVEVKTRRDEQIAPEEYVGAEKQFYVARLASRLQQSRRFADRPFRFDVMAVVWPDGERPTVRHHLGAFESPI